MIFLYLVNFMLQSHSKDTTLKSAVESIKAGEEEPSYKPRSITGC